ncbi:hypothetical protein LCGC14_0269450 [marine sediment metagenome]|uniref:Preprotein translocase subunit YajC n=1 Tax=marine sediment metagenome TaxID=412755 RepID=A0A0F9WK73_9ZZZZ
MKLSHILCALAVTVLLTATFVRAQDDAPADPAAGEALTSDDTATGGDTAAPPAPGAEPTTSPAGDGNRTDGLFGGGWKIPLLILGMIGVMFFFSSRKRRKTETDRRDMLAALSKGDKVTSIGGICGTVIEAREDEIVVKVDETNNVRMRFARWAIRGVGDAAKSENAERDRK